MVAKTAFNPAEHLIDMRGQQYLEVKWRLVWFRTEHAAGRIDTEIISAEPLLVKSSVYDGEGRLLATGHGSANASGKQVVWSGRELEKAETAAIGRALAHAGYGTQFTAEIEADYLADSPVDTPPANGSAPAFSQRAKFVQALATEVGMNADAVRKAIAGREKDGRITNGMTEDQVAQIIIEAANAAKGNGAA